MSQGNHEHYHPARRGQPAGTHTHDHTHRRGTTHSHWHRIGTPGISPVFSLRFIAWKATEKPSS